MAAVSSSSHRRSDPVVFFQGRKNYRILSNIFQRLNTPSDWNACSLVSTRWRYINAGRNPRKLLVRAINCNQPHEAKRLFDLGLCPKFRIPGEKFVRDAEDTPYLRAKFRHGGKIASILEEKDGTFSEEMVKKKLDCLRFDLADNPFSVQGEVFQRKGTVGVGHDLHHRFLLPDLISSFKAFSSQGGNTEKWDLAKSEEILGALERSDKICPSCSPFAFKEQKINPDELIIFSDTSRFKHEHWVSYAIKGRYLAVGNRGFGSNFNPGAAIYRRDTEFDKPLSSYLSGWSALDPACCMLYLDAETQDSGSCSRKSKEAAILGSIGVLLCAEWEKTLGRKLNEPELKRIHQIAISIFKEFIDFDQQRSLGRIMKDKHIAHDQGLYVRFLASLKSTSQAAVDFFQFLASKGPLDWFGKDGHNKIPSDYVPKRYFLHNRMRTKDYLPLDGLISRVVCKAKTGFDSKDAWFWNQIDLLSKYGLMRGFDVQKGTIYAYASLEGCSTNPRSNAQGFLKLSYKAKSKACSINAFIPVHRRSKSMNVALCFLYARFSHDIPFRVTKTKFLYNKDWISFDIQLNSRPLVEQFLANLREAHKSTDLVKKYAQEPKLCSAIKELKKIASDRNEERYFEFFEGLK